MVDTGSGLVIAPIAWRVATVRANLEETSRTRTIVLDVPEWPGHRAGQHVDVKLTAEDGYQAERSYSIASAPEEGAVLRLTVEKLADGEVSPYLVDELRAGDKLELRGPIGEYFAWDVTCGGPLLLVAGGSGIVPLMAMLRHRDIALGLASAKAVAPASPPVAEVVDAADGLSTARRGLPVRLLYSARTWDDVIYRDELTRMAREDPGVEVTYTLTRETRAAAPGLRRRIDQAMLAGFAWAADAGAHIFVCGPTPMVEAAATALVALGHEPERVKTERFGPTGS